MVVCWPGLEYLALAQKAQQGTLAGITSSRCDVLSGVPKGTALAFPSIFRFNNLPTSISSRKRLFVDVCLLYRTITLPADSQILQKTY